MVEVAARQRALAERYVNGVLLLRSGQQADPYYTARILPRSARAMLDGGTAPAVNGDDDQTTIPAAARGAVLNDFGELCASDCASRVRAKFTTP